MRRYSEDQPREENGRWGSGGEGPASGVVFHGTGAEHSLDPSHAATATGNPTAVWGTFFTPSEREAERYVHDFHDGKGVVMSARVTLSDPYRMSFGENEKFQKLDLGRPDLEGQMKELTEKAREFKAGLMKEGYDGIIIGRPGVSRPMEIVAFSSGQIEHQGTRPVDKLQGNVRRYSEDQPRDDHGRFGEGSGSSSAESGGGRLSKAEEEFAGWKWLAGETEFAHIRDISLALLSGKEPPPESKNSIFGDKLRGYKSVEDMKEKAMKGNDLTRDFTVGEVAEHYLSGIRESTPQELVRGMSVTPEVLASLTAVGSTMTLPLSSWSTSADTAAHFAQTREGGRTEHIIVEAMARGIPTLVGKSMQDEVISAGHFRVASVTRDRVTPPTIDWKPGEKGSWKPGTEAMDVTRIRLEPVGKQL